MDLVWSRAWALVGLAVPVIVLLFSLRRDRPIALAIGTFRLWSELPEQRRGGGRRRHVPPQRWLVVLALVCAALALAGPARREAPRAERWLVVVDPSPSMFLPHSQGATRLEVALARLEAERGARALTWTRPGSAGDELAQGSFPSAWRIAPEVSRPAPTWSRHDQVGTVWLTDHASGEDPVRAGRVTSGGPEVPGIVGRAGADWLVWDGASVGVQPGAPTPSVWIDGALPGDVVQALEAWRDARGLASSDAADGSSLRVVIANGPEREFRSAPGDWSARGRARAIGASGVALASWVDAEGVRLVHAGVGEVVVGVTTLELSGDVVAWAVDWAELCDRALAPPAAVVPKAERLAAGEGSWCAPAATPAAAGSTTWPPAAILAALAAGLLFLGLVLGQGRL